MTREGANNPFYGRKHSEETLQKIRKALKGRFAGKKRPHWVGLKVSQAKRGIPNPKNAGPNNGQWKGNNVKYEGLHMYLGKHIPRPELCESCNAKPPYDLANISGIYNRDFKNWKYLCRKCHMKSDGRLERFRKLRRETLNKVLPLALLALLIVGPISAFACVEDDVDQIFFGNTARDREREECQDNGLKAGSYFDEKGRIVGSPCNPEEYCMDRGSTNIAVLDYCSDTWHEIDERDSDGDGDVSWDEFCAENPNVIPCNHNDIPTPPVTPLPEEDCSHEGEGLDVCRPVDNGDDDEYITDPVEEAYEPPEELKDQEQEQEQEEESD